MLTKEHALKIKKKLKAEIQKGKKNRPHDFAVVYCDDKLIASFGIRRGSNKRLPHDHIPPNLHTAPTDCLRLAQCSLSRAAG
jgi:hypothetical protein